MTWLAIGVLAAISFALKAVGPVIVGDRPLNPRAATWWPCCRCRC